MKLIQLHRYSSKIPVYLDAEKIIILEKYDATYPGSKIYFNLTEVPFYIHETPEEILKILNPKAPKLVPIK